MSNFMSNFPHKIKYKVSPKNSADQQEQRLHILPHPAKTNEPRDLEGPQLGAGLADKPEISAHHAHGPQVLSEDIANSLEKPASHQELCKRAEELNS